VKYGGVLLRRLEKLEFAIQNDATKCELYRLHCIAINRLAHPDRMAIIQAARRWYGCNPPYEVTPELDMAFGRWATVVNQLRTGERHPSDSKFPPL